MAAKTYSRKEAFEFILSVRAINKRLGLDKSVVANLRNNHKLGKVSSDKMKEIVERYGATKFQDELWELPVE